MRMRKMSGAWECFTRSRMATLAVNALLLASGQSRCRAAAAAASAGAGWSDPGASVLRALSSAAALPHNLGRRSAPTSPAAGGLFGRHSGGAQEDQACCETKRSSGEEVRKRSRRGGAAVGRTTENMHAGSAGNGGRPAGAVLAGQADRQRTGGFLRGVLGVRVALAATGGDEAGAAREALNESRGGVGQWVKRLQGRSTASCDRQQHQQPRQQQREGSVYARTAAVINAAIRMPSAAGSAAGAVAATPSPSPVPSYLRWRDAAEPEDAESDGLQQKPSKKALPLGVGSRAGQPTSSKEAATASSEEEGSLEAAKSSRGGGGAGAVSLSFKEAMFAGAVSRSIAQTCMQPANVVKTLLQGRGTASQLSNLSFRLLTRGAGAQFIMSLPHGAFNYATLEVILGCSSKIFPDEWRDRAGPVLDFLSSSVATLVCSVVSTPQMVITDRIMAGMYPNLMSGVREITRNEGLPGFYTGWSANVAQKIPSYGLTWVFFQQFKRLHRKATDRPPTNTENFVLGAAAAGATVCIMIPMDTVKTRLVTQTAQAGVVPYKGVVQTLTRIVKEEGVGPIYRSLTPRLVSVVPMIGIQFGIYEFVRKEIMSRKGDENKQRGFLPPAVRRALGITDRGALQPDYFKDFLKNVHHMEEELL